MLTPYVLLTVLPNLQTACAVAATASTLCTAFSFGFYIDAYDDDKKAYFLKVAKISCVVLLATLTLAIFIPTHKQANQLFVIGHTKGSVPIDVFLDKQNNSGGVKWELR